jgi:exfoliative toxin A/B
MTIAIYFAFWNLLRLQFSPGYAAFTFPMAIGATALYKSSTLVAEIPGAEEYAMQLHVLATVELVIAALVICYVLILYLKNLKGFFQA